MHHMALCLDRKSKLAGRCRIRGRKLPSYLIAAVRDGKIEPHVSWCKKLHHVQTYARRRFADPTVVEYLALIVTSRRAPNISARIAVVFQPPKRNSDRSRWEDRNRHLRANFWIGVAGRRNSSESWRSNDFGRCIDSVNCQRPDHWIH